jgi:hypothetical protein
VQAVRDLGQRPLVLGPRFHHPHRLDHGGVGPTGARVAVAHHDPGDSAEKERKATDDVAAVPAQRPEPEPLQRVQVADTFVERSGVEMRAEDAPPLRRVRTTPDQVTQ